MKRHLATAETITEYRTSRDAITKKRASRAPENSGLTKEETKKTMMSLTNSEYKIPAKLMPKVPS